MVRASGEHDELAIALGRVLNGDAAGMAAIVAVDHDHLSEAVADQEDPFVVSRAAAVALLDGLRRGLITPTEAQVWASFVRRGYVANEGGGPVRALDIAFEDAWEDAISAAVSRLDEIGDLVDGEVERGEVLDLLQLLGEQGDL
ncbi:hypothetical protein ASG95_19385 [Phycicoccus sp. Soil803]|nr:hypothetical protein ASG95_19385 [Phycicoccus sp. Soil803]